MLRRLPAALVLEGEAGIGKTTIWTAGLEAARGSSYGVLAARAAVAEKDFGFAVVADLLGGDTMKVFPRLPPPQRRALEVALLLEDPGTVTPDSRTTAAAFLGSLRLLARDRPLLVAIDDVQWIDGASRLVLEFALRRLRDECRRLRRARLEPHARP